MKSKTNILGHLRKKCEAKDGISNGKVKTALLKVEQVNKMPTSSMVLCNSSGKRRT